MNADSGGTNEVHGHDAGHGQMNGGSPLRPDTVSGDKSGHAQLPQAGEPSESGCQTVAGLEMEEPGRVTALAFSERLLCTWSGGGPLSHNFEF